MGIFGIAGGAQAFSSASGGKVYVFNHISTAAAQVVGANASRTKVTFHNPGTIDLFIAPVLNNNGASGGAIAFTPTTATLGGCFLVFANGGTLVVDGECQGAWQAFARSGTDNPLTVMDTNIG